MTRSMGRWVGSLGLVALCAIVATIAIDQAERRETIESESASPTFVANERLWSESVRLETTTDDFAELRDHASTTLHTVQVLPLERLPRQAPPLPVPALSGPNVQVPRPAPLGAALAADEGFTPEELTNIRVYESANRSVVNISTKVVSQQATMFGVGEQQQEGAGSGSVLDKQGHVLTNNHVIEGAKEIEVTLADGKSYEATVVGTDPSNDTAVIKINAPPESLYPITLGDSTRLRVGQGVSAIGNPFGLERTFSTGVVSSLNRSIPTRNGRTIKSIIQIDAAINPGNSGGPLLDTHGRMIGMNTAIASKTGQNTGVGFAIPVNIIARVVPQLIRGGKVIRPETGITRVFQTERGLLIATLAPKGPAEEAGLRGVAVVRQKKQRGPFVYETETVDRSKADLIIGVGGKAIASADDFLSTIETYKPGDRVALNIVREGRETTVTMTLGGD